MERCVFCQGPVDPATGRCQQCGQAQPARSGWVMPAALPQGSGPSARQCPTCGEVLPVWSRFCGRCGNALPMAAGAEEQERSRGGVVFISPMLPGAPGSPSGFVGAPAGPQMAAPGVPTTSALPQSGAPGVPTASAGPQSGAPGVPTAPGGPQGSMPHQPWGTSPVQSAPIQMAKHGAGHVLRGKLLASVPAKIIAAALAVAVVGTTAAAAYVLTRPQPVIQLTSVYKVGTTPAGAAATAFTVSGQKFSSNSLITFLLDGRPAPDNQQKESDNQGSVQVTLLVTDQWNVGKHTLTARDAQGYVTKAGISIEIVAQGAANTPGPNDSPTDLSSFTLKGTLLATQSNGLTFQSAETLVITKGVPCDPTSDTGQPITQNGTYINEQTGAVEGTLTFTFVAVCSGSYRGGKLTYVETTNSLTYVLDDGNRCVAQTPYVSARFEGNFTSAAAITGPFSGDGVSITCARTDIRYLISSLPWTATWTPTFIPGS